METFKKILKVICRILIVLLIVIVISGLGVFGAVKYLRWQADQREIVDEQGNIVPIAEKELEPNVTCLFLGVNGALTDFIMLGQYNPNTREVSLLSIPRDTKVQGTIDGKINSAYLGKYPDRTIEKVKEVTGIKAQYYVVFNTSILRKIVDEIGGVTFEVPFNMNYDDPYQDLYIHLKKGTYRLTGSQAEQLVRFRHSNDYKVGYSDGDVGRVKTQQKFIMAAISRLLEPQNLLKLNSIINIVIDNTKTNITWDVAKNYIDDVATFRPDRITINTVPGYGGYAENGVSYYFYNAEETKTLVDEMFNKETKIEDIVEDDIQVLAPVSEEKENETNEVIKVEVLNAGVKSSVFSAVVEKLNNSGYFVSKVGNMDATSSQLSKVVTYDYENEELLKIMEVVGISKSEMSTSKNGVDFTIILGPKYVLD